MRLGFSLALHGKAAHPAIRSSSTELFFDLWTAHPEVDSTEDWLSWMERLWNITRNT
jgi:hypothetical protein